MSEGGFVVTPSVVANMTREGLLDLVLNEAPHAVVITDPQGVVLSWGRAAEALFGWTAEEAVGVAIGELTGEGQGELAPPGPEAAEGPAKQTRQVVMRRHKEGRLMHVEVSWRTVHDGQGRVFAHVGTKRDVTNEQLQRDVELVHERYRDLLDSVPDAIVIANDVGLIVLLNAEAAELFGVKAETLMGTPVEGLIPTRFARAHARHRERFAKAPERRPMGSGLELRGRRGDGSEFPVEVSLNALQLGERRFSMAALRDRSERIRIEEAQQAARDAQRANKAKTEFLSRMSHELRTPLNSVLGFAELLEEDPANTMTENQRGYVKHVIRSAESLLALINDVLDLSRIESNDIGLELVAMPLAALLDEAVASMAPMARRHQVELRLASEDAHVWVLCDRRRLLQVLLNLLSNGIKYNQPRGSVTLRVVPDGDGCWIQVEDTGRGLSQDQLERLGQPFNRLGAERSGIEGTGIGLTISRGLLLAMGGDLQVESELNVGSRFMVRVPYPPNTA